VRQQWRAVEPTGNFTPARFTAMKCPAHRRARILAQCSRSGQTLFSGQAGSFGRVPGMTVASPVFNRVPSWAAPPALVGCAVRLAAAQRLVYKRCQARRISRLAHENPGIGTLDRYGRPRRPP